MTARIRAKLTALALYVAEEIELLALHLIRTGSEAGDRRREARGDGMLEAAATLRRRFSLPRKGER